MESVEQGIRQEGGAEYRIPEKDVERYIEANLRFPQSHLVSGLATAISFLEKDTPEERKNFLETPMTQDQCDKVRAAMELAHARRHVRPKSDEAAPGKRFVVQNSDFHYLFERSRGTGLQEVLWPLSDEVRDEIAQDGRESLARYSPEGGAYEYMREYRAIFERIVEAHPEKREALRAAMQHAWDQLSDPKGKSMIRDMHRINDLRGGDNVDERLDNTGRIHHQMKNFLQFAIIESYKRFMEKNDSK